MVEPKSFDSLLADELLALPVDLMSITLASQILQRRGFRVSYDKIHYAIFHKRRLRKYTPKKGYDPRRTITAYMGSHGLLVSLREVADYFTPQTITEHAILSVAQPTEETHVRSSSQPS